jgi:hypothetical protein
MAISQQEWIEQTATELNIDAVGLWQVVAAGKNRFKLIGGALTEFVRLAIAELLRQGAAPVVGARAPYYWRPVDYGSTETEILEAVVMDWLRFPEKGDVGGIWFARREMYTLPGEDEQASFS